MNLASIQALAAQTKNSNSGNSLTESTTRGPHFDAAESKNVTALLGKTAYLNCRVKNLANRTVSWVRHRDVHLLTVGRYTYTSDQRFRAIHQPHSEDWILQIKYPQHRDSGVYECQVSSTPHLSHFIHLTVIEMIPPTPTHVEPQLITIILVKSNISSNTKIEQGIFLLLTKAQQWLWEYKEPANNEGNECRGGYNNETESL
ncbi:hypothetical protein JTB14_002469 [Gonioctena quinquepunctata]|nr:hypothetical protein JTB14_002469 [Gonioctena quinquepunctata]